MAPKLSAITNYGMKLAEFAGSEWAAMTFEDRLRNCEEAAAALMSAHLGDGANSALSFILARKGVALLASGDAAAAVPVFQQSIAYNERNKPDRPYNLACAYAALTKLTGPSAEAYTDKAVAEIRRCLDLATDESIRSTVSKAFFIAKDTRGDRRQGLEGAVKPPRRLLRH